MKRLLAYIRNEPLKIVLWIIIVSGIFVSLWMAWGDESKMSTITFGIATAVLAYQAARAPLDAVRERNEAEARNKAAEMCEEPVRKIIDLLDKMLVSGAKESKVKVGSSQVLKGIIEIRRQIMVKGSAGLVMAWEQFLESAQKEGASAEDVVQAGEKLFRALRGSIGHDDSALPFGTLTAFYLTQEDKHMAMRST